MSHKHVRREEEEKKKREKYGCQGLNPGCLRGSASIQAPGHDSLMTDTTMQSVWRHLDGL